MHRTVRGKFAEPKARQSCLEFWHGAKMQSIPSFSPETIHKAVKKLLGVGCVIIVLFS